MFWSNEKLIWYGNCMAGSVGGKSAGEAIGAGE
jgi:hypothetical protein